MTHKLLSVVIPVDNAAKNITHCVAALLRQTPIPDEIIIVYRESDIATADSVREFTGQNNIVIAVQPDLDPQNACDFGIGLAQGKWLYCCDPAGIVSDGFCTDFTQAVNSHPEMNLFCFNSRTDETNPSFSTQNQVIHRQHGLMTAQQALSDILHNGIVNLASCHFIVLKEALDSWQIMHRGPLYQDSLNTLEVFLRTGQTWVSDKCHYSLRSPVVTVKDEGNVRECYDTFVRGYETLTRLSEDTRFSQELRQLYLLESFKSMLQLSQANGIQPPDFLFNAIHYFGRDLRAGSLTDWILLKNPELYNVLFRVKAGTAHV